MAELNAPQSVASQQWGQLLPWWKQQLWDCVPASWRAKSIQARRPAMWAPATDQVWAPGASTLASQTFTRSALAQRGGTVALVAGEANGFRRVVELPLAVAGRLQQVLAFELDRLTPLRASDLYYDFRILDRNVTTGVCRVEVVAVPRARVAPWLEDAKLKNLDVTRLVLAPADIDSSLNLLTSAQSETDIPSRYRWINTALVALCVLLAIALAVFPLWQMRQRVLDLQPIEASAKTDAEAASILQRQLEKQIGEYNLPLARKHGLPLVVQVIDDLTKRLPDDTWAQSFEIKTSPNPKDPKDKVREVIVQGETGSGGKILQLFQESPLLKDPVFKATMTRVAPNAERFHVSGELVAAVLPKSLLLSDAAPLVTVPRVTVVPAAPAGAPASAKAAPSAISLAPASATATTPVAAPPNSTAPIPTPTPSPPATAERRP